LVRGENRDLIAAYGDLAKLVAQEQRLINGQTVVSSAITLRKLVILPRMDTKMDESLVEAMVELCEETSSLEMGSGGSYLQSELVSLERIPEICVRWRRRLVETQRGEILTVYVLSFGLASTQKTKGGGLSKFDGSPPREHGK